MSLSYKTWIPDARAKGRERRQKTDIFFFHASDRAAVSQHPAPRLGRTGEQGRVDRVGLIERGNQMFFADLGRSFWISSVSMSIVKPTRWMSATRSAAEDRAA
jgi:hypothetical protein